jgi:hypothetical protein
VLAFTGFPKELWRQIWSNSPRERLNREIRSRTDVVGIFPDSDALIRLVGAVIAEQHDGWAEGRRFPGLDVLARARISAVREATTDSEEVTTTDTIPALNTGPSRKITHQPSNTTPADLTVFNAVRPARGQSGRGGWRWPARGNRLARYWPACWTPSPVPNGREVLSP